MEEKYTRAMNLFDGTRFMDIILLIHLYFIYVPVMKFI